MPWFGVISIQGQFGGLGHMGGGFGVPECLGLGCSASRVSLGLGLGGWDTWVMGFRGA